MIFYIADPSFLRPGDAARFSKYSDKLLELYDLVDDFEI